MLSVARSLFKWACLSGLAAALPVAAQDALTLKLAHPKSKALAKASAHKHALRLSTPPLPLRWAVQLTPDSPHLAPAPHTQGFGGAAAHSWPQLLALAATGAASNRVADAGLQAAQAQSRQVWANAWMPRIDASASTVQQRQTYNGLDSRIPATSVSLTATLPIWRAAERAAARAQAALADQAQWQARSNRQAVARELSAAYLAAAEAAEQRRLTEAQLALLQEQLRITERRLNAGAGTVLDVLETRTRVDQARAALQDIDTRLVSQRLSIERLVGQPVQLPAGLGPHATDVPQAVPDLPEALRLLALHNPQLQDAQAQIEAARATTQSRRAESWQPSIDAVAQASRNRQAQQFDGISETQNISSQSVGLQLNWALFTGGYHQGRTQEAAALLSQAQARQDEAQAQVEAELRDAYQTLAQARGLISVQSEVEHSATATFEAVRKAFMAGMRTNLDLLNAQQQIYAARQNLVSARINAVSAQVVVLSLLDQLDASGVAALVPLFDTALLGAAGISSTHTALAEPRP